MANFKKEDKASILARLEVLEKQVARHERDLNTSVERVGSLGELPIALPVTADGKTVLTDKTLFLAVPAAVATTEQHKCQTNTCSSTLTKPYDRPSGRLWLCESHKF